jgi:hypothetical protein
MDCDQTITLGPALTPANPHSTPSAVPGKRILDIGITAAVIAAIPTVIVTTGKENSMLWNGLTRQQVSA